MREVEIFVTAFPLHSALLRSDCNLAHIQNLLVAHGEHVNTKDFDRRTPLHIAAWHHTHNLDIVRELLQHGASVQLTDTLWETPLHVAVKRCDGKLDVVKELIRWGSSVSAVNCEGNTPLHIAVERNFLDVSKELIHSTHDVNICDTNGDTALQLAIRNGNIHIMKELLQKGAEINRCNLQWHSPLHTAVQCRNLCAVKELLQYRWCDVNFTNHKLDTPLHLAFEDRAPDIAILKELLNHGALIHCSNLKGITPWSYTLGDPQKTGLSKMMVKYSLLKDPTRSHSDLRTSLCKNFRTVVDCDAIIGFVMRCLEEIARMKTRRLFNFSLYEFVTQRGVNGIANEDERWVSEWILSVLVTDPFPVYCDVISDSISMPFLCDNLMQLSIFSSPGNKPGNEKIILDCYSLQTLITFLAKSDIINLIIAYSPSRGDNKRQFLPDKVSFMDQTGPLAKQPRMYLSGL